MKNFIIIKNKISSFVKKIEVSGDKSISIRCVLLASQAIGKSSIKNLLESEDVIDSLNAIKKLGINYKKRKNTYDIYGHGINGFSSSKNTKIYAGNSGTLARLILGLLVNIKNKVIVTGDSSLSRRDFKRVTKPLKMFGVNVVSNKNSLPVEISGTEFLRPIKYFEKLGSAQCKSAIMLAAIKTPGKTIIKAKKSRDHTEIFFESLGIPIKKRENKNFDIIEIIGQSNYNSFKYHVPGDISSSSFLIVLTLLTKNSEITIKNVNVNESRIGIIKILNKMNAKIKLLNKRKYKGEKIADIFVRSCAKIKPINCPSKLNSSAIDEFLIIFLFAAKAKGTSTFKNLGELNKKESPRLNIGINFLRKIGVLVNRRGDSIKIKGKPKLNLNGKYEMKNFMNDHRVCMMTVIAALTLGGQWKIYDINSVNTSFPDFFKSIKKLGATIN